ncbi:MAG: CerR family C-terminal domain-containing protein, partial [Phycisphaerales bacterium]
MTRENNGNNKGVRDRLLDAAEELFCEKGFEGTSVRDIAASADCNIASVNYYFGRKENLYFEMFRRHMGRLINKQIENMRAIMQSDNPTLEQLLRSLVEAALQPLQIGSDERPLVKMMVREILDPHLKMEIVIDKAISNFITEWQKSIAKLCPGLKPENGLLCVYSLDGLLMHALLFSEHYYKHYPDMQMD